MSKSIFCCRLLRNAMSSSFYRNGDNAIPGPNWHCSINRAIGSGLCSLRSFQQGKRAEIQSFFGKNGLRVRMELSYFIAEWKYQVSSYRFIRLRCHSFIFIASSLPSPKSSRNFGNNIQSNVALNIENEINAESELNRLLPPRLV